MVLTGALFVSTWLLARHTLTLAKATQGLSRTEATRDVQEQRRADYNRVAKIVEIMHGLNHKNAEERIVAEIKNLREAEEARSVRDLLAHLEPDQASTKALRQRGTEVLYYLDEALKGTPFTAGHETNLRVTWDLFHKEIAPLLPQFEAEKAQAYRQLRLSHTQAEPDATEPKSV